MITSSPSRDTFLMDLLNNPQIHSTFALLGNMQGEVYVANDECLSVLEEITYKLSMEDTTLRTYRRAIGFGQNVEKDIIPLLVNMKDPKIIDSAVRLMLNLTVPIEFLFSVGAMSRTEIGRHTIYDLHRLLHTCKEAFMNLKATKSIIDHINATLETEDGKLTVSQCESINNCILLLRNILHIPENVSHSHQHSSMQNRIIWNLFTLNIDKLLLQLMRSEQNSFWGVNIVQVIALMYKDQHVGNLQKLLNHWVESSALTESSDDNESNTSPQKLCCDSSPMLTSTDPTSDSSDNGSGKMKAVSMNTAESTNQISSRNKTKKCPHDDSFDSAQSSMISDTNEYYNQDVSMKSDEQGSSSSCGSAKVSTTKMTQNHHKSKKSSTSSSSCCGGGGKSSQQTPHISKIPQSSDNSDGGYNTQSQGETTSSGSGSGGGGGDNSKMSTKNMSTSSSDDDRPKMKSQHQKPPTTNQKQRFNAFQKQQQRNAAANNNQATSLQQQTAQTDNSDARRKKLVKRSKCSIINVKGIITHTPTDDDITNILKEFTVDFLLKGFDNLVHDLHEKLLNDPFTDLDISHFSWLVTYFLKFAAELELDLANIRSVLTFDVISYLTYEGVHVCEQLEITSRQEGTDLTPYLRRSHLVVAAIREFLQALQVYKRSSHLSAEDKNRIVTLQLQISSTEDLRHLFVLLLRCFNPNIQSLSYLQDLIVTNHILLMLLDDTSKQLQQKYTFKVNDHIQQFATVDIMNHYGTLLENFQENGEYVNDCIFTMIHHVGGDLNQAEILFQPIFLKTFSKILESEFEVCDDWSDLIEYVINKFVNTPLKKPQLALLSPNNDIISISDVWAQEEMDTLYWYYMQSKKQEDIVGNIIKQIKESGQKTKSRIAVIQQLLQQDIIQLSEYDELMKFEDVRNDEDKSNKDDSGILTAECSESTTSANQDDVKMLRDRLLKENKGKLVLWLQQVLIECCYIKLNLLNENRQKFPIMEPICHHCILNKQSVPLVPYNSEQNKILVYQPFVLLLHKLGFHLPADANRLFVRIPDCWSLENLLKVAETLGPLPKNNLKFDMNLLRKSSEDISPCNNTSSPQQSDSEETSILLLPRSISSNKPKRFMPENLTKSTRLLRMLTASRESSSSISSSHERLVLPQKSATESYENSQIQHQHQTIVNIPDVQHQQEAAKRLLMILGPELGFPTDEISLLSEPTVDETPNEILTRMNVSDDGGDI